MRADVYRDILWDFRLGQGERFDAGEKPVFLLRAVVNESELYDSRAARGGAEEFVVDLPIAEPDGGAARRSGRSLKSFDPDEARHIGRALWESLPPQVREPLGASTADGSSPLRLKICSAVQAVTDLPWELLADADGQPLSLRRDTRVVRSVPVRFKTPPLTAPMPVRVLLVLTNPKDERLLQSHLEVPAVTGRLTPPDYELRVLDEATFEALQAALDEFKPHVLHYIGHSGVSKGEGSLILHDHRDHTRWLCGSHVSCALPSTVRLVCLSTCFTNDNYNLQGLTRLAHSPATLHLPTMIANQRMPSEAGVRAFWGAFYSGLIEHGGNVGEAFHLAQRATAEQAATDWASFMLVLRDGTGQALNVVREERAGRAELLAAELSAQVASQLANALAEQIRALDDEVPQQFRELFDSVSERAGLLIDKALRLEDE
jgi:hypothetical protein